MGQSSSNQSPQWARVRLQAHLHSLMPAQSITNAWICQEQQPSAGSGLPRVPEARQASHHPLPAL